MIARIEKTKYDEKTYDKGTCEKGTCEKTKCDKGTCDKGTCEKTKCDKGTCFKINNISDFVNTDDKECNIKLIFDIDEQEYEYMFIDSIRVSDYIKIRYYLILLSSVGIDEHDNISIIQTDKYKIASLGLFYWFNVIGKKIEIRDMKPFVTDLEPKKIKLTAIHIYYKEYCIDCIDVDLSR
jgi:hypothetical protein